jgi:hypothetical protein
MKLSFSDLLVSSLKLASRNFTVSLCRTHAYWEPMVCHCGVIWTVSGSVGHQLRGTLCLAWIGGNLYVMKDIRPNVTVELRHSECY